MYFHRQCTSQARRWTVTSLLAVSGIGLTIASTFPTTAHAQSYSVTKTTDTNDGACDSDCSLREAIVAANQNPDQDVIELPAGTYTLTIEGKNENAAASGDLDIRGDITIVGAGQGETIIDANRTDRIFHLISGHITMSGLTLRNGFVEYDGPAEPGRGHGGAILSSINTIVDLRNSIIESNAAASGGGILSGSSLMTIQDVTIRNNTGGYGGGIALLRTTTILTNTTISDNFSRSSGGGIDVDRATLSATNTTISGNRANTVAGAIRGFDITSNIVLNNSTLTLNHANNDNANDDGYSGSIVKEGRLTLNNTISAQNYEGSGTTRNSNRVGTFEGTNNYIGADARLAPLADNGGPTPTHALLDDSPALDAGDNTTCAATDQRGVARPQPRNGRCDIGAFERATSSSGSMTIFLPLVHMSKAEAR